MDEELIRELAGLDKRLSLVEQAQGAIVKLLIALVGGMTALVSELVVSYF